MKKQLNKKAFTLIELLVVVLIIGILAAVALPQYEKAVEQSRAAEAVALVRTIAQANDRYCMANGSYTSDLSALDIDLPGQTVTFANLQRRQTKYFNYAPAGTVSGAVSDKYIAVANRLPAGEKYFLYAKPNDPRIYCKDYGTQDPQCPILSSDEKNEEGEYIM